MFTMAATGPRSRAAGSERCRFTLLLVMLVVSFFFNIFFLSFTTFFEISSFMGVSDTMLAFLSLAKVIRQSHFDFERLPGVGTEL